MSTKFCVIYTPFPNKESAMRVAKLLLEKKLIACANLIENATSLYFWEGKLEESAETIMIAKTKKSLFNQVKDAISANHPYTCPCIISYDIEQGNESYLQWIDNWVDNSTIKD
ncbi:MAG: divalent-cation tolerance protein CutA [Oligoflexia bacterium]|nr:divalent-cation tolerance protein CutA [Oligoflexia bacterium]